MLLTRCLDRKKGFNSCEVICKHMTNLFALTITLSKDTENVVKGRQGELFSNSFGTNCNSELIRCCITWNRESRFHKSLHF